MSESFSGECKQPDQSVDMAGLDYLSEGDQAMVEWFASSQKELAANSIYSGSHDESWYGKSAYRASTIVNMVYNLEEYDAELNASLGYMSFPRGDILGDGGRSSLHVWTAHYHPNDPTTLSRVPMLTPFLQNYQHYGEPPYSGQNGIWLPGEGHNHVGHISSLVEFGTLNDSIIKFGQPDSHVPADRVGQAYLHKVDYAKDGTGYLTHDGQGELTPYVVAGTRNRMHGSGHMIPAGAWHIPHVRTDSSIATHVIKSPALYDNPHVLLNEAGGPFISPRLAAYEVEKVEAKIRLFGEAILQSPYTKGILFEKHIAHLPAEQRHRITAIANGEATALGPAAHMAEVLEQRRLDYNRAEREIRDKLADTAFSSMLGLDSGDHAKLAVYSPLERQQHVQALAGKLATNVLLGFSTDPISQISGEPVRLIMSDYGSYANRPDSLLSYTPLL